MPLCLWHISGKTGWRVGTQPGELQIQQMCSGHFLLCPNSPNTASSAGLVLASCGARLGVSAPSPHIEPVAAEALLAKKVYSEVQGKVQQSWKGVKSVFSSLVRPQLIENC